MPLIRRCKNTQHWVSGLVKKLCHKVAFKSKLLKEFSNWAIQNMKGQALGISDLNAAMQIHS